MIFIGLCFFFIGSIINYLSVVSAIILILSIPSCVGVFECKPDISNESYIGFDSLFEY